MKEQKTEYDDKNKCLKCGGGNKIDIKDSINFTVAECITECTVCNHKDYWEFGFFLSKSDPPE